MERKGIDVSSWQGKPDWEKVKASGISFAILRITEKNGVDTSFEHNYKGCKVNGIPVGVYKYSYALTVAEIQKEAQSVVDTLAGRGLDFPVFLDLEHESQRKLSESTLNTMIKTFWSVVTAAGYRFGIYCNVDWYNNVIPAEAKSKYEFWLAAYPANDNGAIQERLRPSVGVGWQYSSKGTVSGISGNVDLDVFYKDYTGGNEMNKTEVINKVLSIAKAEVGYLEKASNSSLDSKTANAGSNNYTKYWRDIYPSYQAQPWCAVFVTWVFQQAFGKETAKKMLKHYPYVYVPTLMNLFTRYANPEVGDIVCFYRNGEFTHTGIVTKVSGDRFWTIEGNTSGASGVVANGGGVCEKSYYNSQLPGTKFARPDWSLAATEELKIDANHWLEKGDSGTLVKEVQEDLIYLGFSCGSSGADGVFGADTEKAVKAAQKAYGLTQDGQYGLKTKNAVDKAVEEKRREEEANKLQTAILDKVTLPYIKKGSKGVGVSMLQTMLGTKVTGTFNDDDVKAFKAFQKNTKQSQDGICGENGWKAVAAHILANTK